ncbi:hypothetical protein DY000_02004359 [Brassica cretica]|uniref:Uncharacterized protein n=1 Tax=Brassica cretica TaxID=69181 RepID=A0ABQ7CAY3_BRACR|nr:hypothetical protein DY000_02004359 [Brassica cretica]
MIDFLSSRSKDSDNLKTLKPPPLDEISSDVVRVTLELTSENIEKLRERVRNELARSPLELHLSAFVIAYAYSWTCVVKARATYFGSCVLPSGWFQYEAGTFLKEGGFVKAVEILSDSVKRLGSQGIESFLTDFGWGRPVKTEFVSIDRNEAFSMLERRDDSGGVEIGVCLKKGEMNTFLSLFKDGLSD